MHLTEEVKEAYAYADPTVTTFETFTISHSTWTEDIMLVDSDYPLSTPQGTFAPITLEAALPETESSVRGQMTITLTCLPIEQRKQLYAASLHADPIYVQYRVYTAANMDAVTELPVALSVSTIEFEEDFKTVLTCLYPDLVNIPFLRRRMTTTILPGGNV